MSGDTEQPLRPRVKGWKLLANLVLVVGLVGVFAWQAAKNWKAVQAHPWEVQWGFLAGSLALLLLCQAVDIAIWNRTLGWFTDPLSYRQAAPIYIWSFLARYIPGKVGSLIVRAALATRVNRHPVPVLASSTVELGLRVGAGALLFIATTLGVLAGSHGPQGNEKFGPFIVGGAIALVPLALICAHPRVMLPVINWVLRKLKQQTLDRPLRYREVLGVFAALLLRWAVYGLSYALLAVSLYRGVTLAQVPALAGVASGAWAAGFFGGTPAGIGIAELVQSWVLGSLHYPVHIAIVLPIIARPLTLAGEGLWSLAVLFLHRRNTAAAVTVVDGPPAQAGV